MELQVLPSVSLSNMYISYKYGIHIRVLVILKLKAPSKSLSKSRPTDVNNLQSQAFNKSLPLETAPLEDMQNSKSKILGAIALLLLDAVLYHRFSTPPSNSI